MMKKKSIMMGALILGASACFADTLLLQDTFNTTMLTNDINYDLAGRQTGTVATVGWTDNTPSVFLSTVGTENLRLYKSGAGSVFAQPDKDFATVADDVRISVDIQNMNPADGFSMVNLGVAAADGFGANNGYSFRLDMRYATKTVTFVDSGVQKATMDVTALLVAGTQRLVVDFTGGDTLSAKFNGATLDFGSGQTSYTGTTETENRIQLGWYGDGNPTLTAATFDNLTVTAIPAPPPDVVLLQDTFGTTDTNDINYDLLNRQSGSLATAGWTNNALDATLSGGNLRLSTVSAAGSSLARLEQDFAAVTNEVRISVGIKNVNAGDGFSMVNFGVAAADGFSAGAGYSFRLDTRFAVKTLRLFDNGTQAASMDVTSLLSGGFDSLKIEFTEGNTVSATFNGTAYDFGSGQTSYTGTSEAENHVMLGWYGDGVPAVTSVAFDNLAVTTIADPLPPVIHPATIISLSTISTNVMRMVVDTPDLATNYYPKTISDLVSGTWTNVAHSMDGSDPFVVTNLSYSTAEGANEVIYVRADSATAFFGIGGQ